MHTRVNQLLLIFLFLLCSSTSLSRDITYGFCWSENWSFDRDKPMIVGEIYQYKEYEKYERIRRSFEDYIETHGYKRSNSNCAGNSHSTRDKVVEKRQKKINRLNDNGYEVILLRGGI